MPSSDSLTPALTVTTGRIVWVIKRSPSLSSLTFSLPTHFLFGYASALNGPRDTVHATYEGEIQLTCTIGEVESEASHSTPEDTYVDMPTLTPTPSLRCVSNRRLTSPLASATGDAARSLAGGTNSSGEVPPAESTQLGAAAKIRYAHTLNRFEGHTGHPNVGVETENAQSERRNSASEGNYNADLNAGYTSGYSLPPPPSNSPPTGSLTGSCDATPYNNNNNIAQTSTIHVPAATDIMGAVVGAAPLPPNTASASVEDCQFTLHALRHENQILRQRIEVLTSTDIADDIPVLENDGRAAQTREVPREVLLKRITRLEAALRLEALERDVVEQRLLAQERVLRAVCTPVPPRAPANNNS